MIASSVTGGRVDGNERRKGSGSDLDMTDAAWDETKREQASRVYSDFIMNKMVANCAAEP
jgi:hypothetical protein